MVLSVNLGEIANEFYILLDGEVGIFPLRLDDVMLKELNMLNNIREFIKQAGLQGEVTMAQIAKLQLGTLPPEDQKFAHNIKQITESSVVFTSGYLQEKLGDLPYEMLYSDIFYNSVNQAKPAWNSEIRKN